MLFSDAKTHLWTQAMTAIPPVPKSIYSDGFSRMDVTWGNDFFQGFQTVICLVLQLFLH